MSAVLLFSFPFSTGIFSINLIDRIVMSINSNARSRLAKRDQISASISTYNRRSGLRTRYHHGPLASQPLHPRVKLQLFRFLRSGFESERFIGPLDLPLGQPVNGSCQAFTGIIQVPGPWSTMLRYVALKCCDRLAGVKVHLTPKIFFR